LAVYDKNNLSNCKVFVIVNNVKPYQLTNPTGKAGNDDYSTWEYNFNSLYSPLKEGSNKITSKLTCQPGNDNFYYSVNVTDTGGTANGEPANCYGTCNFYGGQANENRLMAEQ
jgi:hypothetical protein